MASNQESVSPKTDIVLRRLVTSFTIFGLSLLYGWLACIVQQPDGEFMFRLRWNGLLWLIIGFGSTVYFWRKVWPSEHHVKNIRKEIIKGSLVFALPNLWWLTFPLRLHSDKYFWLEMTGLIAPLSVAVFAEQVVVRLVKAFEKVDAEDLKALDSDGQPSTTEASESTDSTR